MQHEKHSLFCASVSINRSSETNDDDDFVDDDDLEWKTKERPMLKQKRSIVPIEIAAIVTAEECPEI